MNSDVPTFVLVTGLGATSFLWNPLVRDLLLRGCRALPVELPGHGFDTVFPLGYGSPQDLDQLTTAASPLAELSLDDYAEHTPGIPRRVAEHGPVILVGQHGRSRMPGRERQDQTQPSLVIRTSSSTDTR